MLYNYDEEHADCVNHPSVYVAPGQGDKHHHRHPYRNSTGNIVDMLSVAAHHCAGPKAVNFQRLNFDFAIPQAKKYRKPMSQQTLGLEDDWEFVDFERVFSRAPGIAGGGSVLENCEILFRSVPDSPVEHLGEGAHNPAGKLNDHPFEFKSKEVSRHNTAPGTPDRVLDHSELRVPSSIAPASLSTDAEKKGPGAAKRNSQPRGSNFVEPRKGQPKAPPRARTTSMSSTASDLDQDDDPRLPSSKRTARAHVIAASERRSTLEASSEQTLSSRRIMYASRGSLGRRKRRLRNLWPRSNPRGKDGSNKLERWERRPRRTLACPPSSAKRSSNYQQHNHSMPMLVVM